MELVVTIYKATKAFPKEEIYGLTSQIRRSAIAIPSNIAEGFLRNHTKEYVQFVHVAFSSGAELETQLEIATTLGYMTKQEYEDIMSILNEVMRMTNKLLSVLKSKPL